jgi:glutathione S-transferase
VPYEIKFYERNKDLRAPKELLKIHPLGKSPIITNGDITLAESGAIIRACLISKSFSRLILYTNQEYIINKYGNGRVAPPKEGELIDIYCWRLLLLASLTVTDQEDASHPLR